MIQQINVDEFLAKSGNSVMRLIRDEFGWHVITDNPSTRAWNGKLGSYKRFKNLAEVERAYKGFRGITALAGSLEDYKKANDASKEFSAAESLSGEFHRLLQKQVMYMDA